MKRNDSAGNLGIRCAEAPFPGGLRSDSTGFFWKRCVKAP